MPPLEPASWLTRSEGLQTMKQLGTKGPRKRGAAYFMRIASQMPIKTSSRPIPDPTPK